MTRRSIPNILQALDTQWVSARESLPRILPEPHEVDVKIILRAQVSWIDREPDLHLFRNPLASDRPSEWPNTGRTLRIFHAGHKRP
jgi:hypothetical protein